MRAPCSRMMGHHLVLHYWKFKASDLILKWTIETSITILLMLSVVGQINLKLCSTATLMESKSVLRVLSGFSRLRAAIVSLLTRCRSLNKWLMSLRAFKRRSRAQSSRKGTTIQCNSLRVTLLHTMKVFASHIECLLPLQKTNCKTSHPRAINRPIKPRSPLAHLPQSKARPLHTSTNRANINKLVAILCP